jgi:hypothetical protein
MRQMRAVRVWVTVAAAIVVIGAAAMLTACGGRCPFAIPPTARPTWSPDAPPTPAVAYPAQGATTSGFSGSCAGWFFRPTVDVVVTALGYYDDGRDGLLHARRSAIFDGASRQVVVETTIQSQSRLEGLFRWEPVGPVVLEAGHEYAMVSSGEKPLDPGVLNPVDASLMPELLYVCCREAGKDALGWCCPENCMDDVLLSGNFKYRPVPAPGPSEL